MGDTGIFGTEEIVKGDTDTETDLDTGTGCESVSYFGKNHETS